MRHFLTPIAGGFWIPLLNVTSSEPGSRLFVTGDLTKSGAIIFARIALLTAHATRSAGALQPDKHFAQALGMVPDE